LANAESFNNIRFKHMFDRNDFNGGERMLDVVSLSGKTCCPPILVNKSLDHLLEKTVDELLSVAKITTLREVVGLLAPPATSVVQLEVPEEVVGDFKVGSNSEDFVDEILNANDTELAQSLFDDFVGEGASASLQLSVSALVDELTHGFEVGVSPSDVRIGDSQHAQRSLIQLNERGVVDLTESQQLEHLSDSGVESVDTPNPHDDGEFGFGGDVEIAMLASVTRQTNFVSFGAAVFFHVLLGALEDDGALGLGLFLIEKRRLDLFGAEFRSCLALLQQSLGDCGEFCRFRIRHS